MRTSLSNLTARATAGTLVALAALSVTAIIVSRPAHAQNAVASGTNPAPTIAPPPTAEEQKLPRPPRARGIPTALAVEAALSANASCAANGFKTTALITDSAGVPIVVISNDGAAAITQRVAMSKAQAVLK